MIGGTMRIEIDDEFARVFAVTVCVPDVAPAAARIRAKMRDCGYVAHVTTSPDSVEVMVCAHGLPAHPFPFFSWRTRYDILRAVAEALCDDGPTETSTTTTTRLQDGATSVSCCDADRGQS